MQSTIITAQFLSIQSKITPNSTQEKKKINLFVRRTQMIHCCYEQRKSKTHIDRHSNFMKYLLSIPIGCNLEAVQVMATGCAAIVGRKILQIFELFHHCLNV